ncbi:MAG: hypothetical protein FWF71_02120 [Actinomycetia bacterium]|nr:hypothetical protein [Actinomycetes bacterium]
MKKIVAILLSAILAFCLLACSGQSQSSSDQNNQQNTSQTTPTANDQSGQAATGQHWEATGDQQGTATTEPQATTTDDKQTTTAPEQQGTTTTLKAGYTTFGFGDLLMPYPKTWTTDGDLEKDSMVYIKNPSDPTAFALVMAPTDLGTTILSADDQAKIFSQFYTGFEASGWKYPNGHKPFKNGALSGEVSDISGTFNKVEARGQCFVAIYNGKFYCTAMAFPVSEASKYNDTMSYSISNISIKP